MKYALNHPWKFEHARLAFSIGLLQTLAVFVLEGVNYIILLIKDTHHEIGLSFLMIVLIS